MPTTTSTPLSAPALDAQATASPACDDDTEAIDMPKRRFLTQEQWLMERHVNDWPAASAAQEQA